MCWNSKRKDSANVVFIAVIVVMVFIVGGSIWMYITAYRYEVKCLDLDNKLIKNRESLYSEVIPPDSLFSAIIGVNEIQENKVNGNSANAEITKKEVNKYLIPLSEVLKIRESQKLLLMRQDQLTDDIRQETNNIINKMNGWLGFWMGVMAILGVFVPIALQFKLYRDNRDIEEKLTKRCHDELKYLRAYADKFEIAQRTAQVDNKAELLKMETDIDKRFIRLQNDYIDKMQGLKITATIRCLYNIMESPGIRTNKLRNQLIEKNWSDISTNVRCFIEYYSDQTSHMIDRHDLSFILVQVASVLESLMILIPRRNRQIESIIRESHDIVQELNSISLNHETIICRLNNYQEDLLNFHPIIILNR